MVVRLRELAAGEREAVRRLVQSRTAPARAVERARIVWLASRGRSTAAIARELRLSSKTPSFALHSSMINFNSA